MEDIPKVNMSDCCRHLSKPLHGYSFYIDAEDGRDGGEAVEILLGKISSLGGNVKHILSHRILYFITTRKSNERLQIRRSTRFIKQNETRAQKKLCSVPVSKKEEALMSTVDRARKLGLNIFTIEKVTKWLKEIERRKVRVSPNRTTSKKRNVGQPQLSLNKDEDKDITLQSLQSMPRFKHLHEDNDEELQVPFIKFEDKKKIYEPQYLELNSFPSICYESSTPRSPFQKLHLNLNSEKKSATPNKSDIVNKSISSTSNYSKSGYCDFCESFFRYRDTHIRSKRHQRNIPYENFKRLDELIHKGGHFNDFLKTMTEKKIARDLINTMEQRKKLSDFLRTIEGKKKAREFFRDTRKGLHEFVYNEGRKAVAVFPKDNEKKVIR